MFHLIHIMGKTSTEFNAATKHFSKLAISKYATTGSSNNQQGDRSNRLSTDVAMIKLLAYTSA